MTSDVAAPKRNGLAVLGDLILAPSAAFASLKVRPTWGWAFVCMAVCGIVGGYLQVDAGENVTRYMFAHDPRFATMTAEQVAAGQKMGILLQHYVWIFYPVIAIIAIFFATLFLLVGNAIGKGTATFAKLFALSTNVSFIHFGIGYLLTGILVKIRGADSFQKPSELLGVVPNLGMLMPGAPSQIHAFFTFFTVTQIWSLVLLALGLRAIGDVKPAIAWSVPTVMALCGALYAAFTLR